MDKAEVVVDRFDTCFHEAAHAVFAYYDGIETDEIWVTDKKGGCVTYIYLYDTYLWWEYARFCLTGAYAACFLSIGEKPLSWLRSKAAEIPEGDAWWALWALERCLSKGGSPFESVEHAFNALTSELLDLIALRWAEIEAVAEALHDRWLDDEAGVGRLEGEEVGRIIESVREGEE